MKTTNDVWNPAPSCQIESGVSDSKTETALFQKEKGKGQGFKVQSQKSDLRMKQPI